MKKLAYKYNTMEALEGLQASTQMLLDTINSEGINSKKEMDLYDWAIRLQNTIDNKGRFDEPETYELMEAIRKEQW